MYKLQFFYIYFWLTSDCQSITPYRATCVLYAQMKAYAADSALTQSQDQRDVKSLKDSMHDWGLCRFLPRDAYA